MTPLTPEEWERVECLAKNFAARLDELPINYIRTIGTTADLSLLLRALAERTAERDEHAHVPMFYGEVMICEKHFWLLWPHGDCAGPGMQLKDAEGYRKQLDRLREALNESKRLFSEIHDLVWIAHEVNRAALAPQEETG
jgi:hypothetical protein